MDHNDAVSGRDRGDERVIQAALAGHREYLRTAEQAHRRAAAALPSRPEVVGHRASPITVAAAHRARSASFAQRGDFLEQLIAFPASGLRVLTAQDMRTLQVPAHIGASAVSEQLGQQITERENRMRLEGALPSARPTAAQGPTLKDELVAEGKTAPRPPAHKPPLHRRSFDEVIYGRAPDSHSAADTGNQ